MKLLSRLSKPVAVESRYTLEDYAFWAQQAFGSFAFQGSQYPLGVSTTVPPTSAEGIGSNFEAYVSSGLKGNGIVSILESVRLQVFSQARFQWRRRNNGRPGDLFGTAELAQLEIPWPGGTTSDLLMRMLLDADLAGNSFTLKTEMGLQQLRPDWTDIGLDAVGHVSEFIYWPEGQRVRGNEQRYSRESVAHFCPYPDPLAKYRGMSWLTPVLRELQGDTAYTNHKLSFIENAATPNLAVTLKESVTPEQFELFVDSMDQSHTGSSKAGKTLYLAGGADVTVVGADMRQLDFKAVQGAGETRLAAAAGVGSVIAQLSEGMAGSSLNAGNYAASRRRFADVTMRHLWQQAAGALAQIVLPPRSQGSIVELWYDTRDISFLQEDEQDAAQIRTTDAATIRTLLEAGFNPDAAVAFVATSGDLNQLKGQHSGLLSVQLQDPTATTGVVA